MSDQVPLSPAAHIGLMNAGFQRLDRMIQEQAPRDCVRELPSLGDDHRELVVFDTDGHARLKVELEPDDDKEEWGRWLLKYVRRKHGRRLQILK